MGKDPVVEAYKRDVDRTLIRENLKLTHEERLLKLIELAKFADELRSARRTGLGCPGPSGRPQDLLALREEQESE